jgi:hypothetical protein
MVSLATLNTQVTYRDGYIDIIDSLEEPFVVDHMEVIETNCMGWGDSNAVVWYDGNHFLATISE